MCECFPGSPLIFSRIFLSWRQSFSIILHLPLRYFPPFNVPLIFILFPMWPPRPLKRFQIHTGEKSNGSSSSSSVPLVAFLMRLCFDTALLWLFFSPLIARIPTSAELWLIIFLCVCVEKGKHKAKEFFGEKKRSMITMFRSSYLWTR